MSDAPLQEVEFCDVCNSLMDPNKLMGIFSVYKLVYKLVYLLVNECFKFFVSQSLVWGPRIVEIILFCIIIK